MAIPASTIQEVITELDIIIAESLSKNNRLGLFAALYRQVTLRVSRGIADGQFNDNERMERLDVVFANRFLEAYKAYQTGQTLTSSWRIAFDAAKRPNLFILQHLLMGMNAHISLDLGIAAAEIAKGQALAQLEPDFNQINKLLISMVDEVQVVLDRFSLTWAVIDKIAGKLDEKLANFNIVFFRNRAWQNTTALHALDGDELFQHIAELDNIVSNENMLFANMNNGFFLPVIRIATLLQNRKVPEVIRALNAIA
ncbi:MAG: hypothetical protein JNL70_00915 [Saprospiraceae bacterium]|nr:hypothetical protein [Saprospiraceae bacterium]